MSLLEQSLSDAAKAVRAGTVSSTELTRAALDAIERLDPTLRAYISVDADGALARAAQLDARRGKGEPLGLLGGVPVAIKDNMVVRGGATTCASRILDGFVSPYDATVIERLREAGAVFLGKTNMDEFAMGSSTENSAVAATRNPWDTGRVPGGSSGGSAAAVAARMAFGALGSDTGGSIRQPASFCGVTGLKPTYGRVSRYGLVAFASSLDQIGTFSRDGRDAALLLGAIAGHDPRDSTSVKETVPDYGAALDGGVAGLRVGMPAEYFGEGISAETEQAVRAAIAKLNDLGAEVVEVSLPHLDYAVATYYIICTAEASSNLARYDGVRYGRRLDGEGVHDMYRASREAGFGAEVKRRILLGTYVLSAGYYDAYYLKALKVRTLIKADFDRAFEHVDCIAAPTSPTTAFRLGEKLDDPLTMYLLDIYTISVNLAGLPGISVPCGFDQAGLPIGLQLIGKPFDEPTLLRAAHAYQQATDWQRRVPPIVDGGA
ncbi:MAG: Asp-tRNA(Asn)/Glu-tRNA(Gln) amidotransferase subunit GatA [Verrucomicrobia bacterium]|nr:Asp-tRNA(Asn)/Glu-tRNA(Gln) amidotransferase subunit GatA [Verrucomicrobiota bacterium]